MSPEGWLALDHHPRMAPRRRRGLRLTTKKTHNKAASQKGGDPSAPTDVEWAEMKFFKTFVGESPFIRLILATSFGVSSSLCCITVEDSGESHPFKIGDV